MDSAVDMIVVSPREISDLVYRCCRVAGCDPGYAERLSRNVLHAEIHRGAAVESFLDAADLGPDEVARWASAADAVERAGVARVTNGGAHASFDAPVPLAALSHALSVVAARGFEARGIPPTRNAAMAVAEIEFLPDAPRPTEAVLAQQRHDAAHEAGVFLSQSALDRLESAARPFLVAESILDAVVLDEADPSVSDPAARD